METHPILEQVRASLAGLTLDENPVFSYVGLWDSDAAEAQLTHLHNTAGRFALVLHERTDYVSKLAGSSVRAMPELRYGVLVSDARWPDGQTTETPPAHTVVDQVVWRLMSLSSRNTEHHPQVSERFRPDTESGRAAARIIYRVGFAVKTRVPLDFDTSTWI